MGRKAVQDIYMFTVLMMGIASASFFYSFYETGNIHSLVFAVLSFFFMAWMQRQGSEVKQP